MSKRAQKFDWKTCFRRFGSFPAMVRANQKHTWCVVCLQVHSITNLPVSMNGESVRVSWRREDGKGEQTKPVKVIDGTADFDEIFLQYFDVPCNAKNFGIMVSSVDANANEPELGNFEIELNELVVEADSDFGVKTKQFDLLRQAAGGKLEISFYYRACLSELGNLKQDRCLSGLRQERGCLKCLPCFMRGKNHQASRVSSNDELDINFIEIQNSEEAQQTTQAEVGFTTMNMSPYGLNTFTIKTAESHELGTEEFQEKKVDKEKITSLTINGEFESDLVESDFLNFLELEDGLDFESVIREAELEIKKASQICCSRKDGIEIEKEEHEELMRRWGLDEDTIQVNSSLQNVDAFGSPIFE